MVGLGDHAGSVIGRKPNTLLISLTQSFEPDYSGPGEPTGLYQKKDLGGIPWYHRCFVQCLTPNTLSAFATRITNYNGFWGNVFEIEVRPIDWNRGEEPWAPGVHLFGVTLGDTPPNGGHPSSGTLATAVISQRIRPHSPDLDVVGETLWNMYKEELSGSSAHDPFGGSRGISAEQEQHEHDS